MAVETLLLDLFSAEELRRWLSSFSGLQSLVHSLPGGTVSPAELVHQAVLLLDQYGQITHDWFEALSEARSDRKPEIEQIARDFLGSAAAQAKLPERAKVQALGKLLRRAARGGFAEARQRYVLVRSLCAVATNPASIRQLSGEALDDAPADRMWDEVLTRCEVGRRRRLVALAERVEAMGVAGAS